MTSTLISNPVVHFSELTPSEETALSSCEEVIEKGIRQLKKVYREVGEALLKIRNERLWRGDYESFDHYCRERWDFGANAGHRYLTAATISDKLERNSLPAPTKQSHAVALSILDEDQQVDVWGRILDGEEKITTQKVELAAKESFVQSAEPDLFRAIRDGIISIEQAYKMTRVLQAADPRVKQMVNKYGINGTSALSIEAIAHLNGLAEQTFGNEIFSEIERTGGFIEVGGEQVHLSTVNGRDIIDATTNVRIQTRQQQQVQNQDLTIQIAEDTIMDLPDDHIMFAFGDGMEEKLLEKGYQVLFVVAAKGDPNFDNERLSSKIRRRKNWLQTTLSRILE